MFSLMDKCYVLLATVVPVLGHLRWNDKQQRINWKFQHWPTKQRTVAPWPNSPIHMDRLSMLHWTPSRKPGGRLAALAGAPLVFSMGFGNILVLSWQPARLTDFVSLLPAKQTVSLTFQTSTAPRETNGFVSLPPAKQYRMFPFAAAYST